MLIEQYEGATRCIPVMPLEEEEGVSLPEIYGAVLVEEDVKAMKKTRRPDERSENKTLDSIRDMFYIEDRLAKRIILKGEAGHGKTVLCLKLIEHWSNVKRLDVLKESRDSLHEKVSQINQVAYDSATQKSSDRFTDEDKKLQTCLSGFDLVFYVPLRHAKDGTSSVVDLVCESVSECSQNLKQKIKQMLENIKIPCLIILDGLDEWRAPDTCRVQGFPDNDGLVNCVVFCTMRPWRMISLRLGVDGTCDKVVQVLGLKHESVERVIENVLVNFCGMQRDSPSSVMVQLEFSDKARDPMIATLTKIPLLLMSCCLVWYEEYEISRKVEADEVFNWFCGKRLSPYFMTTLYLKLIELTITRAENKHGVVKSFLRQKRQSPNKLNIPNILSEFSHIIDFLEVIIAVGRLAFHDLVSEETYLVFPKDKLEREIGHSTVELALKVGILSQSKAPGLSYQQRVCLSFFHKTIQEFIAALYIACGDSDALATFCTRCRTADDVMDIGNVIRFVCGLNPDVGCKLMEHAKDITDSDTNVQHRWKIVSYSNWAIPERSNTRGIFLPDELISDRDFRVNRMADELILLRSEWDVEMRRNLFYTCNAWSKIQTYLSSSKCPIWDLHLF